MKTARAAFRDILAFELDIYPTPDLLEACDIILMRLWVEGYKLVPLDGTEDATTRSEVKDATAVNGGTS